ncbi:MAG: type IX secretion system membrane protein PorP/SprF [Bacteroidota bacterium]
MKQLSFFILYCLLHTANCFAQDPQFSQFYAAPLYLNPAFAGTSGGSRLIANYRHQWPSIPGAFVTYSFSFDHNFYKLNSGMSLFFNRDKAGSGGLRTTNMGYQYSYKLQLSRKWHVRFGMELSYRTRDIDFSSLVFNDQLLTGASATTETPPGDKVSFLDFSSGLLAYSKKYWLGLSAHHLTQPNESLWEDNQSILPLIISLHGGAKIPVEDKAGKSTSVSGRKGSKYISPAFSYKAQEKYDQLDLGLYYYNNPVTIGIWYRGIPLLKAYQKGYQNNDAVIVLIGYKVKDLSIGYSYDLTISKLSIASTAGSHEISIIYEFNNKVEEQKKGKNKPIIVPCAKF